MNAALTGISLALLFFFLMLPTTYGWATTFRRWRKGEPALPLQPRRLVPWGVVDLLIMIVAFILVQSAMLSASRAVFGVPAPLEPESELVVDPLQLLIFNLAYVTFFALALPYFFLVRRASWTDLGVQWKELGRDIRLGLLLFAMLAPIVYAIQGILVQWYPSKHPLIESMRENADPMMLVGGAIAATIGAPLFEEFAFRLLLQGWFENVVSICATFFQHHSSTMEGEVESQGMDVGNWIIMGPPPSTDELREADAPEPSDVAVVSDPVNDPYRSPTVRSARLSVSSMPVQLPRPWCYLPVVVSSLIFALMHYEHGPDWVALFVLAMGLGYVYQRTHRIVPGIVVHFMINAVSFGMLLVQIFSKR